MIRYLDFYPNYPSLDDNQFQQKLYNKKEFLDYKLHREQEFIEKGQYLNHQVLISRFMSEKTLYNENLIYHEMGTGKTCVAFALTERAKRNSSTFKRVHVFARGSELLTALMRSLVYSCSRGYDIQLEPYQKKDFRAEMTAIRKAVKGFYSFHTFLTFAREIELLGDSQLVERYSNCIFVVDEVHNIKGDPQGIVYKQFFRLFHLVRNRKILLLSGTPMRDEVHEIADIMNLILPLDQQMPTGVEFNKEFLTTLEDGTTEPKNVPRLRSFFIGGIIYL